MVTIWEDRGIGKPWEKVAEMGFTGIRPTLEAIAYVMSLMGWVASVPQVAFMMTGHPVPIRYERTGAFKRLVLVSSYEESGADDDTGP